MTQFDRSFVDEMCEKYFESKAYRWLAVPILGLIAAVCYWLASPKELNGVGVLAIVAALLFAHQILVGWLDHTIGNARKLEDVIWRVDEVQKSTWSTYKSGPLLAIKLAEIARIFPLRVEFIEIREDSPWAEKLTAGKQVRFTPKHRFSLTFPGWEKLYDIGSIWKKAAWRKTWLGNYVCGVEEFPVRHGCWIGFSTCPGDTLQEAYESLVESKAPKQVPPLTEFTEEVEARTSPYPEPVSEAMKKVAQRVSPHSPEYPTALMEEMRKANRGRSS